VKLLLQPPLTADSMEILLGIPSGVLSGGFRGRFRNHFGCPFVSCPFWDSRAAGRGRGCGEVGDRSIFVGRLAPTDLRSVAYLEPPYAAFGVWRQLAGYRVAPGRSGGRLSGSTGKV